jgi:hypothetical protein
MELLNNLSDDQLALLGCFVALIVSATIMSLSYYVGPARKTAPAPRTLPHIEQIRQQAVQNDRKAA